MENNVISLLPVLGALFFLLALAGCQHTPDTTVIKTTLDIPQEMFQCEDSGPRPKGQVIMESEVARYIASLEFSNKDCKTRLKELSVLVKCYNDSDCNVDRLADYMGLVREEKAR